MYRARHAALARLAVHLVQWVPPVLAIQAGRQIQTVQLAQVNQVRRAVQVFQVNQMVLKITDSNTNKR